MTLHQDQFDVIVIGAGHAGAEAALAAARAGCRTLILTPNLDRAGFMPCNPSIGGPGKSHLVAEIDALGGIMARAADRAALQVRMLNTSKGPAVQALRIQADKLLYALAVKEALESQPLLELRQDEAIGLLFGQRDGRDAVTGVQTRHGGPVSATSVVLTAGTFLRAAMVAGEERIAGGRAGDRADQAMAASLHDLGVRTRRFKTGTPPRVDARTVDFSCTEPQPGDRDPGWMSRDGRRGRIDPLRLDPIALYQPWLQVTNGRPQLACFRTGTNELTHELIRANLHRAPMFNGAIEGSGPRYCPSVEDKVARFAGKPSHPIFLEPEGWRTTELYVQGMSTSLPTDVQEAVLHSIPALARARITRFGYAVEYDAVDPTELEPTLESRRLSGLFLAGQVNGTSGYEEAGGQGILAGLNAAARVHDRERVVLSRERSYIGVMVDDLVSKPFDEPYRMLTSRAEFRLSLRASTADDRLASLGHEHGIVESTVLDEIAAERDQIGEAIAGLGRIRIRPETAEARTAQDLGIGAISTALTATELLRRPGVTVAMIDALACSAGPSPLAGMPPDLLQRLEEQVKYHDFLLREAREVERHAALDHRPLDADLNYASVTGLRKEAASQLALRQPRTIGEARRLAGVTPADIAVLLLHAARREAVAR